MSAPPRLLGLGTAVPRARLDQRETLSFSLERTDGVFRAVSYPATALWSLANSIARGGTFCAGYTEHWLALR